MSTTVDLISKGNLLVIGRLVDASNATLLAHVEDTDPKLQVIYKPVAGERPLWDFPDGDLASREYAAYLLSDLAGFDLVPLTLLRDKFLIKGSRWRKKLDEQRKQRSIR